MKVSESMTKKVEVANVQDTMQDVAQTMAGLNAGVLPIAEQGRLVGVITDGDIVVRGVAQSKGPDTEVRDIMTPDVKYCFDDQEIGDVMRSMGDLQVRRLPVLNHDKQLVGILSLGDVALSPDKDRTVEALQGISRPGGAHSRVTTGGDQPL